MTIRYALFFAAAASAAILGCGGRDTGTGPPPISEPPTGILMIDSSPDGAVILLDGMKTGCSTPDTLTIAVGTHTVTIELAGYHASSGTYDVTERTNLYVLFLLFALPDPHTPA